MVVVAILAAFAIPNIAEWASSYRLRSSARNIASDMQLARLKAISENNDFVICFKTGSNEYTLIDDNDSDGVDSSDCTSATGDDTIIKTVSLKMNVEYGYSSGAKGTPYGCSIGGSCSSLSSAITFSGEDGNFNPDGSAEGGYVYIKNDRDETYGVGVTSSTGVVKVWRLRVGTTDQWERR